MSEEQEVTKPVMLENPDFSSLKEMLQEHIDRLDSEGYYEDDDLEHYVYEAIMEAFFDKDVWTFVNSK